MRKFLSLILILALASSLSLGCALAETPEREYAEIDWYFLDNNLNSEATGIVDDTLNEYFIEKLNTKVNFHRLSNYQDTMPTKISSGEDLGIVMFGTHLSYSVQAAREAFCPLEELLPAYAPNTYALFSEDAWNGMKINGHIYGIPTWKDNCYIMSLIYNEELCNEMGINPFDYDFKIWTDLIPMFYDMKEKRDEIHPEYADYPIASERWGIFPYDFAIECFHGELLCTNIPGIEAQGADGYTSDTVYCLFETESFHDYALKMQQLVEDGIYAYDYPADTWSSEKIPAFTGWGYVAIDDHLLADTFTSRLRIPDIWWIDTANLTSAGNAISSQCAHPERAMELLELINTDTYVATTLRFGVEGLHHTRDAEGNITFEGTINEKRDVYYYWYGGNYGSLSAVDVPPINGGHEFIDLLKQYNDTAILADNLGFVFDTSSVQNELSACNNVVAEYKSSLQNGKYESQEETEEMLNEFIDKLHANGLDTLLTECQTQLTAWRTANGK